MASSDLPNPAILKFISGYSAPPEIQSAVGQPGDPQLAALQQYFHVKASMNADQIVVDVGSGRGAVASAIAAVWNQRQPPWYYAVDRDSELHGLSLPTRIHNHSKKIPFDDFFGRELAQIGDRVGIIVIRNVLHELDIVQTSHLFASLNAHLKSETDVYIQDLATLAKGERGSAPWFPLLLRQFLQEVGFVTYEPVNLQSYSGNEWFFMIAHPTHHHVSSQLAEESCVGAREAQKEQVLRRLQQLAENATEDNTPEYLRNEAVAAALAMQLQKWDQERQFRTPRSVAGIPLVSIERSELDYAITVSDEVFEASGIRAVIASKNLLDIPELIKSARASVTFVGYSQHSLFSREQNRAALESSLRAEVPVRILIVDPRSNAAESRSQALVYSEADELSNQISQTVAAYISFRQNLDAVAADARRLIELRVTERAPSCSYFFIDDLCFFSLYGQTTTGSTAPCIIVKRTDKPSTYFTVLANEFQVMWETASLVEESTP